MSSACLLQAQQSPQGIAPHRVPPRGVGVSRLETVNQVTSFWVLPITHVIVPPSNQVYKYCTILNQGSDVEQSRVLLLLC